MKTIHNNQATLRASATTRFLCAHADRRHLLRTRRMLGLFVSLGASVLFLLVYVLLTRNH